MEWNPFWVTWLSHKSIVPQQRFLNSRKPVLILQPQTLYLAELVEGSLVDLARKRRGLEAVHPSHDRHEGRPRHVLSRFRFKHLLIQRPGTRNQTYTYDANLWVGMTPEPFCKVHSSSPVLH